MKMRLKTTFVLSLWLFCQTVTAANPPTTISPGTPSSPGTLVGLLTPTFSWSPVSGATGYGLYIRDLTAPGSPLIYPNASGITANPLTGSSFTIPNGYLANGRFYRWNMTSFAGSTESSTASSVLYFQTPAVTASPPTITSSGAGSSSGTVAVAPQSTVIANPPTINAPGSLSSPGMVLGSLTPTFGWNWVNGATGYGLYIRDMTVSGTPLIYPNSYGTTYSPLTGTSFTLPANVLVNGHSYRWNMTSFTGSTESSAASGVLYFQTPAVAVAATSPTTITVNPPTINAPGSLSSPGIVLGSLTPAFGWNSASGATGYGLYIRDMTAAGTPLIYPNANGTTYPPLTGTSFTLPANVLVNGHSYRWNMTSFNGSAEILSASSVLYFQTPPVANTPTTTLPSSGGSVVATTANPTPTVVSGSGNLTATALNSLTETSSGNSTGPAQASTAIGSFKGVTAFSNGSVKNDSGIYNTSIGINSGLEWQCVEYINRYYYLIYGINIRIPGQNADQYYPNASSRNLTSFQNGGNTSPEIGDILCFRGGAGGHVAIITQVSPTQITVIQQNVTESSRDAAFIYPMTVSGEKYTVDVLQPGASRLGPSYYCQGWLRKPTASAFSSGSGNVSGIAKPAIASSPQVSASAIAPNQIQNTPALQSIATRSVASSTTSRAVTYVALTVRARPNEGGTVNGGGDFASGSSQTVTVTPNNGFIFERWTENDKTVSVSASYNFTINGSRYLVAHFRPNFRNHPGWSPNSLTGTNQFRH
jgi:surface antigen